MTRIPDEPGRFWPLARDIVMDNAAEMTGNAKSMYDTNGGLIIR